MAYDTILVVDDEHKEAELIASFLRAKRFTAHTAFDGAEAVDMAKAHKPDVVLLDIGLPKKKGTEALLEIKEALPDTQVIIVTAIGDIGVAMFCMQNRAFAYLTKPVDLDSLLLEVNKALHNKELETSLAAYQNSLEEMVNLRTGKIEELNNKLRRNFVVSIKILVGLLEMHDPYLGGHLKRVALLAGETARCLKLSNHEVMDIELAGLLHDIGTFAVPKRLLEADFESLSKEEAAMVKQHPVFAQNIIAPSDELTPIGIILRSHLELLDGSGFPDGLKGGQIPIGARILGVVNAYDEMVTRRRFSKEILGTRQAKEDYAFKNLYKLAEKHFSRNIIEALEAAVQELRKKAQAVTTVDLRRLTPGMTLAADLQTMDGLTLMAQGHLLGIEEIEQLKVLHKMGLIKDAFQVIQPQAGI